MRSSLLTTIITVLEYQIYLFQCITIKETSYWFIIHRNSYSIVCFTWLKYYWFDLILYLKLRSDLVLKCMFVKLNNLVWSQTILSILFILIEFVTSIIISTLSLMVYLPWLLIDGSEKICDSFLVGAHIRVDQVINKTKCYGTHIWEQVFTVPFFMTHLLLQFYKDTFLQYFPLLENIEEMYFRKVIVSAGLNQWCVNRHEMVKALS